MKVEILEKHPFPRASATLQTQLKYMVHIRVLKYMVHLKDVSKISGHIKAEKHDSRLLGKDHK